MREPPEIAAEMMKPCAGAIDAGEVAAEVGNVKNNQWIAWGFVGRPECVSNRRARPDSGATTAAVPQGGTVAVPGRPSPNTIPSIRPPVRQRNVR